VVEQQIFWLQIPVNDVQLVQVLNPGYNLVEKFNSQWLFNSLVLYYEVKKFSTLSVLHDKVELFWSLYNFIELNDVWMSNHL